MNRGLVVCFCMALSDPAGLVLLLDGPDAEGEKEHERSATRQSDKGF